MTPLAWVSPSKIASLVIALILIQILGSVMRRLFGARTGAILAGFLGGLVSSTATTAAVARRSDANTGAELVADIMTYLSATEAMLIQGLVLVWVGTSQLHLTALVVFAGPFTTTGFLMVLYSRKLKHEPAAVQPIPFQFFPILKLLIFIVSAIYLSNFLQTIFGQSGLIALTSIMSLFEIHGSIIANVQLHENGQISTQLLSTLLAFSILSSYLSKLFLISTLGNPELKKMALRNTLALMIALGLSWVLSMGLAGQNIPGAVRNRDFFSMDDRVVASCCSPKWH